MTGERTPHVDLTFTFGEDIPFGCYATPSPADSLWHRLDPRKRTTGGMRFPRTMEQGETVTVRYWRNARGHVEMKELPSRPVEDDWRASNV